MIGTCPNKNTVEWKNLAKQTGEELAELAFVANGYVIPIVPTIAEIKKGINYSKTKNSNTIGRFALKVRQYNAVNGTSHSFTTTPLYGDTVEITMHLNYLAVNVEAQRQRDAIREDSVRVADNSAAEEAFRTLYDPSTHTSSLPQYLQ